MVSMDMISFCVHHQSLFLCLYSHCIQFNFTAALPLTRGSCIKPPDSRYQVITSGECWLGCFMSQLRVHTVACVAVSLLSATPLLARGYPGPSGACRPPHLSRHQTGVAAAPDVQMVFSNGGPAPRLAGHRCTGPAAAGWAGRGRRGLSDLRPGIPSRVWSRWCSPPQPH